MPASRSGAERGWVTVAVAGLLAAIAAIAALVVPHLTARAAHYEVDGTQITGPDGKPFVPVGVNLLGPNGFFNRDAVTAGLATTVRDRWGLNTVRLNSCLPIGCPYGQRNHHNDDLDALVREYTRKGLVVVIALHQDEPGTWPSAPTLDAIDAWWRATAARYKGNGRVWFNLLNEPGSDTPVPERWLQLHERLLRTVRSTGASNVVVVDGSQWGQESGDGGDGPVGERTSAILRWGKQLRAVDSNVLFSFHVYDQWGQPELSDEQRDQRLADFVDRVHAAGLAVMIGETGGADQPCCDPASLGTAAAYRVAARLGIGLIAWHGQAVDGQHLTVAKGRFSSMADLGPGVEPDNLTWQGKLLWELARR
ncbi:MAG: hypothetical protein JWO68_1060 [Actinomycetia bacterium]|nr:hypothetical protein [Actinomycetes bacterium]